jgi:hypothetical protein
MGQLHSFGVVGKVVTEGTLAQVAGGLDQAHTVSIRTVAKEHAVLLVFCFRGVHPLAVRI